jgi:hypothetical protein
MNLMWKNKKEIGIIEYVDENIGFTCYFYYILNKLKMVNNFYSKKFFFANKDRNL